jgi:class 3 adenylate cyclase
VVTFDPLPLGAGPLLTLAPRRVLDHGLLTSDAVLLLTATTLFVDLTGFTATTERMTRGGSRGVERLSDRLRGFFGDVADTVTAAGGDLLAFGGDAITAVFDGPPAASLDAAAAVAEEIADLARRSSGPDGRSTQSPPIRLEARIGIARGEVATTVVRSSRRSLPVHLGRGLDLAVAAQATAGPGRAVIDPSALPSENVPVDERPVAPTPPTWPPAPAAELARLAPALVVDRITAGRPQLRSHRRVCVAFVRFPGIAVESLPGFLPTIGSLLDRVDAWEGEVVQVSGGDKGLAAMVVFGAPLAHGDDPLRATEAMLRLRDEDGSVAVGIATGPVYAALLGSRQRLRWKAGGRVSSSWTATRGRRSRPT